MENRGECLAVNDESLDDVPDVSMMYLSYPPFQDQSLLL